MHAALRPYVTGGVALVGASLITVTPMASQAEVHIANMATRLVAASSPLNIPVNLFNDIANIPANEIAGINQESAALFYTGSWWVSDATNLWGTDPGDPPKYVGASDILVPFPAISGPLGTILSVIAEAELPINSSCGATTCPPFAPFDPVGAWNVLTGQAPFPLVNNWFTVSLPTLFNGYTFPTATDFVGPVPTNPFGPNYPLAGTGTGNTLPWSGSTVSLNQVISQGVTAFVNQLMADPSTNPITIPTGTQIAQALANIIAATVVDFDPFTPGMSWCPSCTWPTAITPVGIAQALETATGSPLIAAWLANHGWQVAPAPPATGLATTPNTAQAPNAPQPNVNAPFIAPTNPTTPTNPTNPTNDVRQNNVAKNVVNNGVNTDVTNKPVTPVATAGPVKPITPLDTVPPTTPPQPGPLGTPRTTIDTNLQNTGTSTDLTRGGDKFVPGQVGGQSTGGKSTAPGGGATGAGKSFTDQINSAVANVTKGVTGAGAGGKHHAN